jgi:hypothetical protein
VANGQTDFILTFILTLTLTFTLTLTPTPTPINLYYLMFSAKAESLLQGWPSILPYLGQNSGDYLGCLLSPGG